MKWSKILWFSLHDFSRKLLFRAALDNCPVDNWQLCPSLFYDFDLCKYWTCKTDTKHIFKSGSHRHLIKWQSSCIGANFYFLKYFCWFMTSFKIYDKFTFSGNDLNRRMLQSWRNYGICSYFENWNLGFLGIPVYARWLFNGTILVVVHIRVMKHYVTITANRFC